MDNSDGDDHLTPNERMDLKLKLKLHKQLAIENKWNRVKTSRKRILKPIQEEESQPVIREAYKMVFERCHADMKKMKFNRDSAMLISLHYLESLLREVEQIRQESANWEYEVNFQ